MDESSKVCLQRSLQLTEQQNWRYETDEFHGICEIAKDHMVIKCVFEGQANAFYDVLGIDGIIKWRLAKEVSVERLAEQLAADFPDLNVTVKGRAKTHGWITSSVVRRYPAAFWGAK